MANLQKAIIRLLLLLEQEERLPERDSLRTSEVDADEGTESRTNGQEDAAGGRLALRNDDEELEEACQLAVQARDQTIQQL